MESRVLCDGVQITPSVIEFRDIVKGCIYQTQICVQNFGGTSKRIRFHAPSSEKFLLDCKYLDKVIAPGLKVFAVIEFHCDVEENHNSKIVLLVDEDPIEIPLTVITSEPRMEITGDVNFGNVTADGKVLRKEIAILNRGSMNGAFKLVYEGEEPILIIPKQGVVKAGYSQPIRFELTSKKPGNLAELVKVSMEGQPDTQIHVVAQVTLRSLQLLTLHDNKPVNHINFGPTFYGTDVLKSYLIFNKSPERVSFVVILEEDGEGQEVGVNISLIKSAALLDIGTDNSKYEENDLTTLVTAFPSQGTLAPFEKRLLHFKFSPRFSKAHRGWSSSENPIPRKDYALFLHIDIVGSMSGNGTNIPVNDSRVEVALTGTALPVILSVLPSPAITFDNCPVGSSLECKVTVRNDSTDLPCEFIVSRCAHFVSFPQSGKLEANGFIDLLISFRPNQVGHFMPKMNLLVQGFVVENYGSINSLPTFKQINLNQYPLQIEGTSLPVVGQKTSKSLSAQGKLYPQEENEDKIERVHSDLGTSLRVFRSSSDCMLESKSFEAVGTRDCKIIKDTAARIAKPDDLAMSIRPSNKRENVLTKFTKTKRYTYIDPDYEYDMEEEEKKRENKQKYTDYIHSKRSKNTKRKELKSKNPPKPCDIGISVNKDPKAVTSSSKGTGMKTIQDITTGMHLLTSKNLESINLAASNKKVSEGLKALPTTEEERAHCSKILSPLEIYQIGLEPKIIDFGEVCGKSLASRELKIVNSLQTYIHIKVEIDCRELRQTSPLSQIVPPGKVAALEFIFEPSVLGAFQRSVSYSINDHHHGHLVVLAEVVNVSLTLSSNFLSLSPSPGLPPDAGMREEVTLYNKHNITAHFSWTPVVGKEGTAFSVRPARGAVESNSNLVCEVVFYPSFYAPLSGMFELKVENGNQLELNTHAEIAPTSCSFVEHRVMFGAVPLNLVTTRSAFLKNTSQNHAYFKVSDVSPIPGMTVSPSMGVVPIGGSTELRIDYTPFYVQKFDTQIEVAIRGWKPVYLRMGGHVEAPCVDIDIERFQFGGVYCGAMSVLPFKLKNMARSRAKVTFDLKDRGDFSVKFGDNPEVIPEISDADGCFETALFGQQELQCYLEFRPTEIASYDFIVSAVINETTAPSPPPSPYPASVALSKPSQGVEDLYRPSKHPTPSRRIQATALRAPLQISNTEINFNLPPGYYDMGIENAAGRIAGIMFVNNSNATLKWLLNLDNASQYIEDGVFQLLHRSGSAYKLSYNGDHLEFPTITLGSGEMLNLGILFTPGEPGVYETHIPVILDDDYNHPYRVMHLWGELAAPTIHFEPTAIQFLPAPLRTRTSLEFSIIAQGFRRAAKIEAVVPKVELEDGSEAQVFDVEFPNGNVIEACCRDVGKTEKSVTLCRITFESSKPASIHTSIEFFTEQLSCSLPVIATADNCLLTSYKFLAAHQADFHIVCDRFESNERAQKDKEKFKLTSLVPSLSAIKSPTEHSNTTTSTSFGPHSSTYEESSFSSSTAKSPESDNKDGEDHEETTIPYEHNSTEDTNDSDEERFIKDVIRSVQRWFSSQAWANGPSPIVIPYSLRSCFSSREGDNDTTRAGIWSREKKKESKTIFDVVAHLCGKAIPGIPINGSIPTESFDRTRYIHWMYTMLINFLRCQGAIVASLQPEFLLDKDDFKRFVLIKREDMVKAGIPVTLDSVERELERYGTCSKRAWTDLLLQIIKVLVLNRITPQNYRKANLPANYAPLPPLNVDPFSSNVFSVGEKIILAWLNHHFQQQRKSWLWKASITGEAPVSRWIVNFENDFLDGLVLASILAAYAPFIVPRFLYSMYTHPTTAEQCLHNTLKVVASLRYLGMDYDVVATDITEPNPINILFLCMFLYHRLPNYIPRSIIQFNASLHSIVTKKVKLQNPSSKPIVYQIIVAGENAADFRVPCGKFVKVSSKSHIDLEVQYKGRFLRSCSAVLILVGKRSGFQVGSTLVFRLSAAIDTIIPLAVYKTETPCYDLKTIEINIKNPFEKAGIFKVVLVEVEQQFNDLSRQSKEKTKKKSIKNVESRTDHGRKQKPQKKEIDALMASRTIASTEEQAEMTGANISVFWCSSKEISIGTEKKVKLNIEFLPFTTGHFQCSVLLINEEIGDIVYSIEAESTLPLPSLLPNQTSIHSVNFSNQDERERGDSSSEFDTRTVYWRCNINDEISEDIIVPLINEAREKALVLATQQRMSEKELYRREVTGILSAATISNTMKLMGLQEKILSAAPKSSLSRNGIMQFEVEGSSNYFKVPSQFDMNLVTDTTVANCTARIPLKFIPDSPGHYQCCIVLRAPTDIRVFQVEVTVNPEGSDIELEFTSPTHEIITQNIPVVNNSEHDWTLTATIDGAGFCGPKELSCPRLTTASYALQFQPLYEGVVKGSLKLTNTVSGTETVFLLSGEGRKPLPADHVELNCQINDVTLYEFQIPNTSKKKIIFQAFCDLDFIIGPESLVVLPNQKGTYTISVKPWKRGVYDGVLSFVSDVADSNSVDRMTTSDSDDDDDDNDNDVSPMDSNPDTSIRKQSVLPDFSQHKFRFGKPFRIWYSLRITSRPAPPLNTLEVECACHNRATIELLIENPTNTKLDCDVLIEGQDLIAGEEVLSVQPRAAGIYHVDFAPTVIGKNRGSVIFQHPLIGEVWYDLILISVTSIPKELKMMQCSLGSKCIQMIRIDNPTDEIVNYDVICSNTRNFCLDLKNNKVDVLPHSGIEVPLKFSPSALGRGLHYAEITFRSSTLGDFIFKVTGNGLFPVRSSDHVIRTSLSSSSSTIISFENPFEEDIIVNVDLLERAKNRSEPYLLGTRGCSSNDVAFTLLLRKTRDILLAPLSKLGIPICFSPESMIRYEAVCTVTAMKTDGSSFENNGETSMLPYGREMKWVFPVVGIPEFSPLEGKKIPSIECKAKQRVEELLQLSFTGLSTNGSSLISQPKITSSHILTQSSPFVDFGPEYSSLLEDFTYDFDYSDAESHSAIDRSVGINLVHKKVHNVSGVITFVFSIVFSPYKTFSHVAQLVLTSSKGGVWRYPLKFIATEADPDDVIELKAVGLNKDASVGFRLTSQSDSYVPFWASIEPNNNQTFSVSPLSGELPPINSPGQLFKVTYRPKSYGKIHTSKLLIQTPDVQWTYALRGGLPKYSPPLASNTQDKMKK